MSTAREAREVYERIKYLNSYMSSISPKLARYAELKTERDQLVKRRKELNAYQPSQVVI